MPLKNTKIILTSAFLILGGFFFLMIFPKSSYAATFYVNSTSNAGDNNPGDGVCDTGSLNSEGETECTLQAAISETNSLSGSDTINFDLPESDPNYDSGNGPAGAWTIKPSSTYVINDSTGGTYINGFSQTGTSPNTNPIDQPDNAVHRVEVNVENLAPTANVFWTNSANNRFRGIVVSGDPTISSGASSDMNVSIFITGSSATNNRIDGCYFGIGVDGYTKMGFSRSSNEIISLIGGGGSVIGSNNDGFEDNQERNIISNHMRGIGLRGGNSNITISNNFFGTDRTGVKAFSDNPHGTSFYNDAIGMYVPYGDITNVHVYKNVFVSYDAGVRLFLTYDNNFDNIIIEGNNIGTDLTGTVVPTGNNNAVGVQVQQYADGPEILGLEIVDNVIGSNYMSGVALVQRILLTSIISNVEIEGNYIGVDRGGTIPLPNWDGIIHGQGDGTIIEGNTVAYNENYGINISRFIDPSHEMGGPNANNASYNLLVYQNSIYANGSHGILMENSDTVSNTISQNSIYGNGGLGIDLNDDGPSVNDTGDADTGPNNIQNYPEISLAVRGSTDIEGDLNASPNEVYTLEFFYSTTPDPSGYGEGEVYIGSTTVTTDLSGHTPFVANFLYNIPIGSYVTATATDSLGNTSEFSSDILVLARPIVEADETETPLDEPVTIDIVDNDSDPDGVLDYSSISIVSGPSNGHVEIDYDLGRIIYTPDSGFSGEDEFVYQICDDDGLCNSARVTVRVTGLPQTGSIYTKYFFFGFGPYLLDPSSR